MKSFLLVLFLFSSIRAWSATPTNSPTLTRTPSPSPTSTPTRTMTPAASYVDVFNAPGLGPVHYVATVGIYSSEVINLGKYPGRYVAELQGLTGTSWAALSLLNMFDPGLGVTKTAAGFSTNYIRVFMRQLFPVARATVVVISGVVTATPDATNTPTPTISATVTRTPTISPTFTVTPNRTQTYYALVHAQMTRIALTMTNAATATSTRTITPTATFTPTITQTFTFTPSVTPTPTP